MTYSYINDLLNVGKTKLLGYLPLITIENENFSITDIISTSEKNGLKTFLFTQEECSIMSGALYVADIPSLQKFLSHPTQKTILTNNNWPVDASEFVYKVSSTLAKDKKLVELIALTFCDKRPEFQHRNAIEEVKSYSNTIKTKL